LGAHFIQAPALNFFLTLFSFQSECTEEENIAKMLSKKASKKRKAKAKE
jgi:hypothetical protein